MRANDFDGGPVSAAARRLLASISILLMAAGAAARADAPVPPGADTRRPGAAVPAVPIPAEARVAQEEPMDVPEEPPPAVAQPERRPEAPVPATRPDALPQSDKPLVALELRCRNEDWGRIVIELEPEKAPKTVANFLRYVDEGFYDGTIFHRVIQDFIAQGGGYISSEAKKENGLHEPAPSEADNGLKNLKGTIAAARGKGPHSAQAQFFINLSDNPRLDHPGHDGTGYAVFGRVIDGLDAVRKFATMRTRLSRDAQRQYMEARRASPTAEIPRPPPSEPLYPATIVRAYRLAGGAATPSAGERRPPVTQPAQPPEMPPPPPPEMEPEPVDELQAEERLEDEPFDEPEAVPDDPGREPAPEPEPEPDPQPEPESEPAPERQPANPA